MIFLTSFLVLNIILSVFFEKRRWHVAVIAHAVLFALLLVMLAFINETPAVVSAVDNIVGEAAAHSIRAALVEYDRYIGPLALVEIVSAICWIATAAVTAEKVIKIIIGKSKTLRPEKTRKERFEYRRVKIVSQQNLYKLNCKMNC